MARKTHAEGMRERRNMKEHTRREGDWCVVGYKDEWEDGFGLQGYNYSTKEEAETRAEEIGSQEEYKGVVHEVMTHEQFEEMCAEKGVEREFYW